MIEAHLERFLYVSPMVISFFVAFVVVVGSADVVFGVIAAGFV